MGWEIETTDCFDRWLLSLPDRHQVAVLAMVFVLEQKGPQLARPYADTICGARHMRNLKELRVQSTGVPLRVFYAFGPEREFASYLKCQGVKK